MSALLLSTVRYRRLSFGKGQIAGDSQRRYVRIVQGIFTGLAGKGVAVVVGFILVPLTVKYLGPERYGAWVTISAAMAWIALADFGLSNSLTNAVSEGYAKGHRNQRQDYMAAAFWSLAGVAALLGLIFLSLWGSVSWDRIFNV